jgi:hypothetical protein
MNKETLLSAKEWLYKRLGERTTYDGAVMIGAGIAYLVFEPIAAVVAYAAIAYGAWTIWKKETR